MPLSHMTTRARFVGHSTAGVCSVWCHLVMCHSESAHNVQRQHSNPPCPPHDHSFQNQTHVTPHAHPHLSFHGHHSALSHSSYSYTHFYQVLPHHTIHHVHLLHPLHQHQPHVIQPQPFRLPRKCTHFLPIPPCNSASPTFLTPHPLGH